MLYLQKNNPGSTTSNTVVLTLYEKTSYEEPHFTWRLVNKTSQEEYIFNTIDISEYPEMYNKFLIKLVDSSPVTTLGVIVLPAGEYNYTIYESGMESVLDIAQCTGILEEGILKCELTVPQPASYNYASNTKQVWNRKNNE